MGIEVLFIIAGIVCFLLSAFGVGARVNWFHLGWAFLAATLLV